MPPVASTAVSPKGSRTQEQILEAATRLFAARGYEGTGIRDIELAAGVNRGVVTYHFGNKEDIWKAMFGHAFMPYLNEVQTNAHLLAALPGPSRIRFLIAQFVRRSAERPYMNQLMIQENFSPSWRMDWITKNFLQPFHGLSEALGGDNRAVQRVLTDPHLRYALLGACNMAFSLSCEAQELFDCDVRSEAFIERHIALVIEVFEGYLAGPEGEEEKSLV